VARLQAGVEGASQGKVHATGLLPALKISATRKRSEAALILQHFVRRRSRMARWLELSDDCNLLRRRLRVTRAATAAQCWWRRARCRMICSLLFDEHLLTCRFEQVHKAVESHHQRSLRKSFTAEGVVEHHSDHRELRRGGRKNGTRTKVCNDSIRTKQIHMDGVQIKPIAYAATIIQAHTRRAQAKATAIQHLQTRNATIAYTDDSCLANLKARTRDAVFWQWLRRLHAAALRIQGRRRTACGQKAGVPQRGVGGNKELARMEHAILGAQRAQPERVDAAWRLQGLVRGLTARAKLRLLKRARHYEGNRMMAAAELQHVARTVNQAGDALLGESELGSCQLASVLSRLELDELQVQAASKHALHAHELDIPSASRGPEGCPTTRPIVVFDSTTRFELAKHLPQLQMDFGRQALLRQEMRGLTIDRESRAILSRPLHRLEGLGANPAMPSAGERDLLRREPQWLLLEKLEGDLVHFWELDGRLHAATRIGRSPAASEVEDFVRTQVLDYVGFSHYCISSGLTPVFVWQVPRLPAPSPCSSPQGEASECQPVLVLIALRHMVAGLYVAYAILERIARHFQLPVVSQLAAWSPPPPCASLAGATEHLHELVGRSLAARCSVRSAANISAPHTLQDAMIVDHGPSGLLTKLDLSQPLQRVALCATTPNATERNASVQYPSFSPFEAELYSCRSSTTASSPLVELDLHFDCGLGDLQHLGGAALCANLAEEMCISAERLDLRGARLVPSELQEPAPTVEVTFKVLGSDAKVFGDDAIELPSAVAAAALLGSSRQRLSRLLGLPLVQLPSIRMELLRCSNGSTTTVRSSDSSKLCAIALPERRTSFPLRSKQPDLPWSADCVSACGRAMLPPATAGPKGANELLQALEVVHGFARERMCLCLPLTPPTLAEMMTSTSAQSQLLQLLQAVLVTAERLPPDGCWARERPALVSAASLLVLTLQQCNSARPSNVDLESNEFQYAGVALGGLAACTNRALDAFAHAGRAIDAAMKGVADTISMTMAHVRQRAWAGAARPEPCRVRTFVRLRPPSTFEVLWSRGSKRIAWGTHHADINAILNTDSPAQGVVTPIHRIELNEVFEPSASQQRVYSRVLEPLIDSVLVGLDCALLCVGESGTGKTYTLHGTESAQADPLGAPRIEWGMSMRACEALLHRTTSHTPASSLPASSASAPCVVHASFVEIEGEQCFDLLRGGAMLAVEIDEVSGTPCPTGAVQLCIRSLEDAAYALRVGLRSSNHGVLVPRAHTILTLTVKGNGISSGEPAKPMACTRKAVTAQSGSRLVLVDLASGELYSQHAAGTNRLSQRSVSHSLSVLGACVAARSEGATRGVPWRKATLALLLREVFTGSFCTAVLAGCGSAEGDVRGTTSTLQFMMHAGRLANLIRMPQPRLGSLLRKLRALDEQRLLEQQRWLDKRPPTLAAVRSSRAPDALACELSSSTGGAEDADQWESLEIVWFQEFAAQLGITLHLRDEQAAMLRANLRETQLALAEAARQRHGLPWEQDTPCGTSGAHENDERLTRAGNLVRALDEWMIEARESLESLRRALW